MDYTVKHASFGTGYVKSINDGIIELEFNGTVRKFQFPKAFEAFLSTEDEELLKMIADRKKELESEQKLKAPVVSIPAPNKPIVSRHISPMHVSSELVGDRAKSIEFSSKEELFEIVGYMARPGRIKSIEAEVPKDGRDKTFEKMFPGQTYRPIEMGDTPSGLPNKMGPQFRINFSDISNCPSALKMHLGKGNASCVARINRSRFVIDMVQNYGFRFGSSQNVNNIREIAEKRGCGEAFEKGYNR